jgi:hypothetical protein
MMRALTLIVVVLSIDVVVAAAQTVPTPAGDTTVALPPAYGSFDRKPQFRLQLLRSSSRRSIENDGVIGRADQSLGGFEVVSRSFSGPGVSLRYQNATPAQNAPAGLDSAFSEIDARAILGDYGLAIELGWLVREAPLEGKVRKAQVAQIGMRSQRTVGTTGVYTEIGALYRRSLIPIDSRLVDNGIDILLWGVRADASIRYAIPRYPAFIMLGYAIETWAQERTLSRTDVTTRRNEATSSLLMGVGIQRGMR